VLNPRYVNPNAFRGFRTISISDGEAMAANALALANKVVIPTVSRTHERLEKAGFDVVPVDISELQKAEAGLTCMSVIFEKLDKERLRERHACLDNANIVKL